MRRDAVLLAALFVAACDASPDAASAEKAPATPPVAALLAPPFTDVERESGITAENHTGVAGKKAWLASAMGGGAIVLDYDQDGRMDLVVVDGTMLTDEGDLKYDDAWRTHVYHNDGGMKFTDVTAKCGVDLKAFGVGGASCDYDGDGWPDFYVTCWGRNRLYHNRGDGTFEEVAEKAGVAGEENDFSTGCCFGDVNGDGFVDLYVARYVDQRELIRRFRTQGLAPHQTRWHGVEVLTGPTALHRQPDVLYFGDGDGAFRDVTRERLGTEPEQGYGFQPVMTDLDGDGDLDIYVPNDLGPNLFYRNDGRGTFAERGYQSGVAVDAAGRYQASMGVDVADVNRDGRLDIVVTEFSHDHDTLYVNETEPGRRPSFRDMSAAYGVTTPSFDRVSWGVRLLDYDGDGALDLFVACGHIYPEVDEFPQVGAAYKERCLLLHGVGPPSWAFEDATDASGPAFQEARVWRGAAFADFDDDGDVDVFVTALNDKPALLRNDVGNRNAFLVFRLVGKGKLRDPCGALVTVFLADGRPRVEELHHGISFCSDDDPRLFFGLGAETSAKRVLVRWPDGEKQEFADVAARKFYVVEEGVSALREDRR